MDKPALTMTECKRNCWIAGAVVGLIVVVFAWSGLGGLAAIVVGVLTAAMVGGLLTWAVCGAQDTGSTDHADGKATGADLTNDRHDEVEAHEVVLSGSGDAAHGRTVMPVGALSAPTGLIAGAATTLSDGAVLASARNGQAPTFGQAAPTSAAPTPPATNIPVPAADGDKAPASRKPATPATPAPSAQTAPVAPEPQTLPVTPAAPAPQATAAPVAGRSAQTAFAAPLEDTRSVMDSPAQSDHHDMPGEAAGSADPRDNALGTTAGHEAQAGAGALDNPRARDAASHEGEKFDELGRILGIGPKLTRWLNENGIFRFDQIAAWSGDDIAAWSEKLGRKGGRIRKDDWVGQARILAAGGETEHSRRVDRGEAT